MKNIYKKFDNVQQFYNYIATGETQQGMREDSMREVATTDTWTTTENLTQANELFSNGDEKNAALIESAGLAKERVKIRTTADRRQLYASQVGFMPHVPNYVAGVPCNMINERRIKVKQKVINLVYNISVGGSISGVSMRDVAVKMLSAILRAEAQGVRINLYVCDISDCDVQQIGWLLRIKSSGQHLDVLKTAYPLINPSMLRRHSFRFTEITKGVSKHLDNYGRANPCADNLLRACGLKDAKVLSYYTMTSQTTDEILKSILS